MRVIFFKVNTIEVESKTVNSIYQALKKSRENALQIIKNRNTITITRLISENVLPKI